jgi:hypothetical protein
MARRSVVGRVKGMRVVRLFGRSGLPLAILLVIGYGTDSAFGSQKRASHAELLLCRMKAERVSNQVNPYTRYVVKGA